MEMNKFSDQADLSGLGSYEECMQQLSAAKDDTKRVTYMSQIITILNAQINDLRFQIDNQAQQAQKEYEDLLCQLNNEKNLRLQVQEEKGAMKVEFIQKLDEKDRVIAHYECQMGIPISSRYAGSTSPDFLNKTTGVQGNKPVDKKLLLDFVKHHKNQKNDEEASQNTCAIKHRAIGGDTGKVSGDETQGGDSSTNQGTTKSLQSHLIDDNGNRVSSNDKNDPNL